MDSTTQCKELVKNALTQLEEQVDAEIEKFNDIESIRNERLKLMKKEAEQHSNWLAKDHGTYSEIEEKELFQVCKQSSDVVVHFFTRSCETCKVFDHHLLNLARQHVEARFIKINAEKSPFLTERFGIKTFPTILFIKDNKTQGKLIGLSKLGNVIDFPTDMLKWRIAQYGVIRYDGDLNEPPDNQRKDKLFYIKKKTIREKYNDDNSDDEF